MPSLNLRHKINILKERWNRDGAQADVRFNALDDKGSRSSSRVSHRRSSCVRKGAAQRETSAKLNLQADEYLPDHVQQVVKPKQTALRPPVRAHMSRGMDGAC